MTLEHAARIIKWNIASLHIGPTAVPTLRSITFLNERRTRVMRDLLLKHLLPSLNARALEPLNSLQALWPLLVGSDLAVRSRPEKIERDTLVVACATAALAQEVRFAAPAVLEALRDAREHAELPSINRVVTRAADPSMFPPPPPSPPLTPLSTAPLSPLLQTALDAIEDDALRTRLERISRARASARHTPTSNS